MGRSDSRDRSRNRSGSNNRGRSPPTRGGGKGGPSSGTGRGTTVWVGGLPDNIEESRLRSVFERFGPILEVRMKLHTGRAPPFAFIEFVKFRDAQDSIKDLKHSTELGADPLKIDFANSSVPKGGRLDSRGRPKGKGKGPSNFGGHYGYGGGHGHSGRYDSRNRRGPPGSKGGHHGGRNDSRNRGHGGKGGGGQSMVRMGDHKITIENLPSDMTWTELKELGRQYVQRGELTFARTYRSRDNVSCGLLEFQDRGDADEVIAKLDGKRIKGHDSKLVVKAGERMARR